MIGKDEFILSTKEIFLTSEKSDSDIRWNVKKIDSELCELYDTMFEVLKSEVDGLERRIRILERMYVK